MASRLVLPFADVGSGVKPSSGAKLFFFDTGTSTPKDTYSDASATTPNSNPVIADSNGVFPDIFITGTYKVQLKDKNDVQAWEADPVDEFSKVVDTAFAKNFDTLALSAASTTIVEGDVLNIKERTSGNGGGGFWDVVLTSGVTPNTFNIVIGTGNPLLSLVLRTDGVINVKQFGATGDGSTDDASPIQAAFDIGGHIVIPPFVYKIGQQLTITVDNTYITAYGAKFLANDGYADPVIFAQGSLDSEVNTVGDYDEGEINIVTATSSGYVADDYLRIISQRNALSDDAPNDWRLGFGTPGAPACYFSEYIQVRTVSSPTAFDIYGGLAFPDYRDDNTQETDLNARARTTLQKVNFIDGITIEGLSVEVAQDANGVIRLDTCSNAIIRDCKVDHQSFTGAAVFFVDCLYCYAETVTSIYGPDIDLINKKALYNPFKTAGSQSCGFRNCTSSNASQGTDFTYFNLEYPSIYCFADGMTINSAQITGITSHGGTFAIRIENNTLAKVRQGVSCRSRSSVISNNTATYLEGSAPSDGTHYAYGLFEGWARDCVISNNTAIGFYAAVAVNDGADFGETFGYVGATITGNTGIHCRYGFSRLTAIANTKLDINGIVLANNVFKECNSRFILIEERSPGTVIKNNIFHSITVPTNGIHVLEDSHPHTVVTGNTFINFNAGFDAIRVEVEASVFPFPTDHTFKSHNNEYIGNFTNRLNASATLVDFNQHDVEAINRVEAIGMPDGITAPSTVNGSALLYVDVADGDFKIVFGDGTVKTIATDT